MTRWRTVLGAHALLTLAAIALAAPVVLLVGARLARHPDGDLALWSHSGSVAADVLLALLPLGRVPLQLGMVVVCVWALLGPLTTGLLLDAHQRRDDPGLRRAGDVARRHWGPFLVQRVAHLVALLVVVFFALALVEVAVSFSASWVSPARRGIVRLAALTPALALAALAGAATDLSHALVVQGGRGPVRCWVAALRAACAHPRRIVGPYVVTMVAIGIVTVVGAMLAAQLGGRAGLAAWILPIVQQAIALGRTALRAGWLETVLGLTSPDPGAYASAFPTP